MEQPKIDELLKEVYKKAFEAGVDAGSKQAPKPPPKQWAEYVKQARAWGSKGLVWGALVALGWLLGSPNRDQVISSMQGVAGVGLLIALGVLAYEYMKGKK